MRYVWLLLVVVSICFGQKPIDPDKIVAFNITVNSENTTVKTQMLKNSKEIKVDNTVSYLWYTSNKIMETKGGYDGKLLHGYYKSFYLNNQLKEKGRVKYGLKNKQWKYWYENGMLREVITWKDGKKNGLYEMFNDNGNVMARGNFKDDLLHGKFYTYDKAGKIIEKKKFKNGNEIIKPPKKNKPVKSDEALNKSEKKKFKDLFHWRKNKTERTDKEKKIKLSERMKRLFMRNKDKSASGKNEKEKVKQ